MCAVRFVDLEPLHDLLQADRLVTCVVCHSRVSVHVEWHRDERGRAQSVDSYRVDVEQLEHEPALPGEPDARCIDEPPGRRRWYLDAAAARRDLQPGVD